jgi:hypothetical protein
MKNGSTECFAISTTKEAKEKEKKKKTPQKVDSSRLIPPPICSCKHRTARQFCPVQPTQQSVFSIYFTMFGQSFLLRDGCGERERGKKKPIDAWKIKRALPFGLK